MDREVARLTAAKLKAQKQASEKTRMAAELSKTCAQQKKRLAAILHDQRNLVVQLGVTQQKAGTRGRYLDTDNAKEGTAGADCLLSKTFPSAKISTK